MHLYFGRSLDSQIDRRFHQCPSSFVHNILEHIWCDVAIGLRFLQALSWYPAKWQILVQMDEQLQEGSSYLDAKLIYVYPRSQ